MKQAPAAPSLPPAAQPTPNSPVNSYVQSGLSGAGPNGYAVPGFSSPDGNTDLSGFINATVGGPPGSFTHVNGPVYGAPPPDPSTTPPPGPNTALPPGPSTTPPTTPSYINDPGYQAALAQEQMGSAQGQTQLNAARAQLIAQFGDPNLASMAGFGLDPQSAAFAQQNYLSGNATLARLDKQHGLQRQAVINQLAGHGLLNSGDLGYGLTQSDSTYGNNVYDAQQSVLQQLAGLSSAQLAQVLGLHQNTVSALQNAYQFGVDHPDQLIGQYGGGNTSSGGNTSGGGDPYAGTRTDIGSSPKSTPASTKAVVAPIATKVVSAAKSAVTKKLANSYVTGQKARG